MKSTAFRTLFCALCIGLIFLTAWPGLAATRSQKSFSVSPMLGGYVFEGDQGLDDNLTYSLGLGYNLTDSWSTEFVLNYLNTDFEHNRSRGNVDGLLYRLDTLYHFMPESNLVPYLAGGIGGITLDPDRGGRDTDLLVNYGVGLKYFFTDSLALRGDLRHVLAFGDPENNFIYTAGLTYLFGGNRNPAPMPAPRDKDGDGVIDANDACPDTPPGAPVDRVGCPLDSDRDGVPDFRDKCPDTPNAVPVNKRGCPLDKDGDGVSDMLDACPGTPAGTPVDAEGCPNEEITENDNDGDGVTDAVDKCPGTPQGLMVDKQGCPISLTLAVEFDVDKSDIKPRYHGELQRGAEFIRKYPKARILIAGHTDWTASDAYNLALSQRRADSVRNYLVEHFGIRAERLDAKGYGESFPIADNTTAEGRQRNRRVELSVYALSKK